MFKEIPETNYLHICDLLMVNIVLVFIVHLKDILASTFSQCCVIWNVKEKKPIFKLSDANSRV